MVKPVEKKSSIKIGDVVNENYKVLIELGRGGFGAVYEVEDARKKMNYALKVELERPKNDEPGLKLEICVLKRLQSCDHVVRYIDSGIIDGKFGYLIMQLIGRNLGDFRRAAPDQKFTLGTAIRTTVQCLNAIEAVHESDLLHRDIKPGNFAIGKAGKDTKTVFILDFGMVRRYRNKNGVLRKQRPKLGFRGTVKYASPNVHANTDISRRDDLWSWLYMVIEFMKGTLPWQGVADKIEVGKIKIGTKAQQLEGLTPEITKIYESVAKLKWNEEPQYDLLKKMLTSLLKKNNLPDEAPFDWEEGGMIHKALSVAKKSVERQINDKLVKEKIEGEESKTESSHK